MTLPPGKDPAASRDPGEEDETDVAAVIRNAFAAARRSLRRTIEKQHGETKDHREQQVAGIVERVLPDGGYGFIRALEGGHEICFHHNSVANEDFDGPEVGAGVIFTETKGEKGPQASTVRVLDHAGSS